jgi:hypothetical protein
MSNENALLWQISFAVISGGLALVGPAAPREASKPLPLSAALALGLVLASYVSARFRSASLASLSANLATVPKELMPGGVRTNPVGSPLRCHRSVNRVEATDETVEIVGLGLGLLNRRIGFLDQCGVVLGHLLERSERRADCGDG